MCIPNFFGIDFDGDGEVSAFESFLTYQAINGTIDAQNADSDSLDSLDELDALDSFDNFDDE